MEFLIKDDFDVTVMKYRALHPWQVTISQAKQIQRKLSKEIKQLEPKGAIKLIAGADISYARFSREAYAGIVILTWPQLEIVEKKGAKGIMEFPYVPGLLTFREGPILIEAWAKIEQKPDLVLFDGHGLAHPEKFGLASHMGLLFNIPSIGCAKKRLVGTFEEPGTVRGSFSYLYSREGEVIGAAVRTKTNTRVLFISVGHAVTLSFAVDWVLKCTKGYRLTEPQRQAHIFVNQLRAASQRN